MIASLFSFFCHSDMLSFSDELGVAMPGGHKSRRNAQEGIGDASTTIRGGPGGATAVAATEAIL